MKRPATLDEPKPAYPPCPRCGGEVVEKATREGLPFFHDLAEKHRMPSLVDVPVIMCRSCRTMAAHVAGIEDIWRDDAPGLKDRLVADAADGLRQRRWLDAGPGDPMGGYGGIF